jgi:hypothetical protein
MGVFDARTKTVRAVSDPGTDDTLPPPGALSWGSITSASGLGGTTGADAKLVHGDRWQQVTGKQVENILVDFNTTIGGNQNHQVTGNQTLATTGNVTRDVVGNLSTTVIGAELRSNIGVQNHTHAAPRTNVHSGEKMTEESGSFLRSISELVEFQMLRKEVSMVKIEAVLAAHFSADTYKLEVVNTETKAEIIKGRFCGFTNEAHGFRNFISALRCEMNGTATYLRALKASMEPRVHVPPEAMVGLGPA